MKQISRLFILLTAAAMLSCTACREETEDSAAGSTAVSNAAQTTAATAETGLQITVRRPDAPQPEAAKPGEAFLYLADASFGALYDGSAADHALLRYGAGKAAVTGNGRYTVSVDCTDPSFQYEISNGTALSGYRCTGLQFAAVRIAGGAELFPDLTVEINEIRVDGRIVPLTAVNYTCTESGAICANIYHPWVRALPADAKNFAGEHIPDGTPGYSACIVSPDSFLTWGRIEADFTVSGAEPA